MSAAVAVAVMGNQAELSSPCSTIRRQALKASLLDLRRLLSSPILRCGPMTRNQPSSEGHTAGSELAGVLRCGQSFACGGSGYAALPLHVLLLLRCGGVDARAVRKGTWADWARKLEKENGLNGPLNGSHLTFYSILFSFLFLFSEIHYYINLQNA
jgi:hypothetical protein